MVGLGRFHVHLRTHFRGEPERADADSDGEPDADADVDPDEICELHFQGRVVECRSASAPIGFAELAVVVFEFGDFAVFFGATLAEDLGGL